MPNPSEVVRVLLIDDDVDSAELWRTLLEMNGHACEIAHDGVAGLEAARRTQPDVLIVDLDLPLLDGCSVARAIRKDASCPRLIIALTGSDGDRERKRAREAGFDLHLVKPVEPSVLLKQLNAPVRASA